MGLETEGDSQGRQARRDNHLDPLQIAALGRVTHAQHARPGPARQRRARLTHTAIDFGCAC